MVQIAVINPDTGETTYTDFEPPAPLDPVYIAIPRYVFWLAVHDSMTEADGVTPLTKDYVLAAIDASTTLTDEQKYLAKLGITDAVTYVRDDPNVVMLLALMGYSADQADTWWLWAQPAV